ncbi:MAG: ABC transporter permease [Oscillospiraceae bacterium]|nr:ABC transporter permease [Oscillospiraceae bacterium]
MLKLMKADIYRLLKGKALYITIAIALIMTVLTTVGGGTIGVSDQNNTVHIASDVSGNVAGSMAPFVVMAGSDTTLFLILAVLFALAATDFSSGAIKNTLSSGVSRMKYYFAKVILGFSFVLIITLLNILVGILVTTAKNGFGGSFDGAFIISVLKPYASQLLMFFAAVCIGNAIVFVTQKGSVLNSVYIAFFYGMSLIFFMITTAIPSWSNLNNYAFVSNLQMLSAFSQLNISDIVRALSIGVFWIIISTVLGIIVFRKSEIK